MKSVIASVSKQVSKQERKKERNNTRSFGMGSVRDLWLVDLPISKCTIMTMSMRTRMITRMHLDSDLLLRSLA
jgi:hypothetical protein